MPRSRLLQLLSPLLLLLLFSANALAQTGRVELVVSDPAGKKLGGVAVTAIGADGSRHQGETNKKGKLEISLPPGTYDVTLEASGMGTRTIQVDVKSGTTTTADVGLLDQATANKQMAIEAFNQGVAEIQTQKAAEALASFTKAAELDPTLADAHRLVAILEAEAGNLEAAGAALDEYLKLVPDGLAQAAPAAYDVFRARGETDKLPPIREHLRALGAASDFAIKVYNEGVAALREEKKSEAIALFTEATTLDPEMATGYRSLAALHFNDKEYEPAKAYLEKLLSLVPNHAEGNRLMFFSQLELGETDSLEKTATSWAQADSEAASSILEHAEKLFKANQTDRAQQLAEIVLGIDDDNGEAHWMMGRVLAQKGQIADAKQHLQRFLDLAPQHAEAGAAREMLAGL